MKSKLLESVVYSELNKLKLSYNIIAKYKCNKKVSFLVESRIKNISYIVECKEKEEYKELEKYIKNVRKELYGNNVYMFVLNKNEINRNEMSYIEKNGYKYNYKVIDIKNIKNISKMIEYESHKKSV